MHRSFDNLLVKSTKWSNDLKDKEKKERVKKPTVETESPEPLAQSPDATPAETSATGTEELEAQKLKVQDLEQKLQDAQDKYLRLAAELDNFRKRREREVAQIIEYAGEEVLRAVLPVLDDLERATRNCEPQAHEQSLQEGLELIYRKLQKIFKDMNVEPIETLNQPFNPDLHHAVLLREQEGVAPETVVEEYEKGYKYKDHVLRYAKVVVSK